MTLKLHFSRSPLSVRPPAPPAASSPSPLSARRYPSVTVPLSRAVNQPRQESTLQTHALRAKGVRERRARGGKQTEERSKVERSHLHLRDQRSPERTKSARLERRCAFACLCAARQGTGLHKQEPQSPRVSHDGVAPPLAGCVRLWDSKQTSSVFELGRRCSNLQSLLRTDPTPACCDTPPTWTSVRAQDAGEEVGASGRVGAPR